MRKKPSEYEVVTGKFHYHFRQEPAPFELDPQTPVNTWYLRYREGSAFQAESWEGLRDPQQLNYRRYVKQQHEREAYLENLLDEFERQNHDAQLDPPWVKVLERFVPSRYPLHVLQMSGLYLGQMAPSAYIANPAFFQASDELRALQWVAYRAKSLSLVHYAELASSESTRLIWEEDLAWQPLREVLEHLLIIQASTLTFVEEAPTRLAVPNGRAFILAEHMARGQPEAFITGREFAIVRADGSTQLSLPPVWGQKLLNHTWATTHPLARYLTGAFPPQSLILYAPRDSLELAVAWKVLQAAYWFARGEIEGQPLPDSTW